MATGQGKGYRNIVGRDSGVHRDSAQGIKQPQKVHLIPHIEDDDYDTKPYYKNREVRNIPHTEALKDYDEYLKKVKDKREHHKPLTKQEVINIQNKAKELMEIDNTRLSTRTKLLKDIKKGSLDIIYYYILEDANYHTLNTDLEDKGAFKKPYGEDTEIFEDYRKKGGKTWMI